MWVVGVILLGGLLTALLAPRQEDGRPALPLPPLPIPVPEHGDGGIEIVDVVGMLKKGSGRYSKRELSQIERLVIHHSLTTSGSAKAYARYHVDNNGWPGIGYHFVIDKDGTINRTQYLDTISYHVRNGNTPSVGICLTGDYRTQTPPLVQIDSCVLLCRHLINELGRNLAIHGHGELQSDKRHTCPGPNLNVDLIEERVYQTV